MGKIKFQNRIALGSIAVGIFISVTLTGVIAFTIKNQNDDASSEILKNGFAVVIDELTRRQDALRMAAEQLADMKKIKESLFFLRDYKNEVDSLMTNDTLILLSDTIYNVGKTADAWKTAIYDKDGDLVAFAVFEDTKGIYGFAQGFPDPVFKIKSDASDSNTATDFNTVDTFDGIAISHGDTGTAVATRFALLDDKLCIVSTAPVFSEVYNAKSEQMELTQVGTTLAVQSLGTSFSQRLAGLTGTGINLFAGAQRRVGTTDGYDTLVPCPQPAAGGVPMSAESLCFNEIRIEQEGYYQAILPLFDGDTRMGTVASAYSKNTANDRTFQMVRRMGLLSLGCILLIFPVALLFSRGLTRPVTRIITGLTDCARHVTGASGRVSAYSHALSEGASSQAASIEETSSSLEEMSAMTRQNASNAASAERFMKKARGVVATADQRVSDLTNSMMEISSASERISKIVKSIDEIAFQTNLLALNAAVEAARAGEAGAGFAVVADEVRNLALRTAQAAQETENLIADTVKKIDAGVKNVKETSETFTQVSEASAQVNHLVAEIAAASSQQAQGIDQITAAVSQVEKVIQENVSGSEESALASEQMDAQAQKLTGIVSDLLALVGDVPRARKQAESPDAGGRAPGRGMKHVPQKPVVPAKRISYS